MPDPPMTSKEYPQQKRGSWISIALVTLALLFAGTMLLVLPLGYIGIAVIVGAVFFIGLVAFHYVVWGRWITRIIEREQEEEIT